MDLPARVPVSVSVEFRVEVVTRPWEVVLVTGNVAALGNWQADDALPLVPSSSAPHVWVGHADVAAESVVEFRYVVAQYLDAAKENVRAKQLLITRWETIRRPRSLIPQMAPTTAPTHQFGCYDGKQCEDEGWLAAATSEIRLRLHGDALRFFKSAHQKRVHRIKVTPVDLRFREASVEDDNDEDSRDGNLFCPELPSYSQTQLAVLSDADCDFREQDAFGRSFRCCRDYFVFRTKSVATDFLGFLIDFYVDAAEQRPSSAASTSSSSGQPSPPDDADRAERIGFCYLLPSNLKDTYGSRSLPITGLRHQPVGKMTVDYLLVHPLSPDVYRPSMQVSYARHWKKRGALDVGHRGLGMSYSKHAAVRENTMSSLFAAAARGADFVEFDVQLSKDREPVVYHDFHVCVSVTRRRYGSALDLQTLIASASTEQLDLHQLAIKDLRLSQLHLLKLRHGHTSADVGDSPPKDCAELSATSTSSDNHRLWDVTADDEELLEHQPFPTLKQVLLNLNPDVGCNVEVKFPMLQKDGTWECDNYWERNEYVDRILADVLNCSGERRILFSSFDPDICTMLKLKQNKYPVLVLSLGLTTRYMPFLDVRSGTSEMGVAFAHSNRILGVNFHSEDLLRDAAPVELARSRGLVSFVWGDDLDNKSTVLYFKELGLDGLIYDR